MNVNLVCTIFNRENPSANVKKSQRDKFIAAKKIIAHIYNPNLSSATIARLAVTYCEIRENILYLKKKNAKYCNTRPRLIALG